MFDGSPDPLLLARFQFAFTAATHYLFVAFTLGMAPYILGLQWRAVRRRDPALDTAVRFWGGLYLVNYAMGILSGLVMELQLATNWAGLSDAFGAVFGAPLAVETMAAFFVESTFLGLWIFGWDRMGRWAHWGCFLVVTATAYLSAYWVLVANGFLKHPGGFRMEGGTAVLEDPAALLLNPSALLAFFHVVFAAMLMGGSVVVAVSAYHLARGSDTDGVFRRGIRGGTVLLAAGAFPTVSFGGTQFALFGPETPLRGATYTDAEIDAIEEAAEQAGGTAAAFGAAGEVVMYLSWLGLTTVAGVLLLAWLVRRIDRWRWLLWPLVLLPVLPYAASVGGWVFRETQRQPWTVRHHLTTADAMTDLSPAAAAASLALFTLAFAALGAVTFLLLVRYARRGPAGGPLAAQPEAPDGADGSDRQPAPTF
ncbi:cytochrome ubiquinol oxidase subunit I [Nocardiopsis coralliicola]